MQKTTRLAEQSNAALRAAVRFSQRSNTYFYGLQIVVSGLFVYVCELYICKGTHDTTLISNVGQ